MTNNIIEGIDAAFSCIFAIVVTLAIFCILGEPDLLDQFIAMARNYSETIKCK